MTERERAYQGLVAQGWAGMLLLLLTMFITDLVEFSMRGEYRELSALLSQDPGASGLWVLTVLICLNVTGQMAIRSVHRHGCRWRVFWCTVTYAGFFVAHQAVHLWKGDGFDLHFLLDLTHHIVGGWAAWAAYMWARLQEPNPGIGRSGAVQSAF